MAEKFQSAYTAAQIEAAIRESQGAPVTLTPVDGVATINFSAGNRFFLSAPAGAVELATDNEADMKEVSVKVINPNSLVSFPAAWVWKTGAPPPQPPAGYNIIHLTAVEYDSAIKINAENRFVWYDVPANCVLWLDCEGVNGATAIVDGTGRHIPVISGTGQVSNEYAYTGATSVKCYNGGDGGIQIPSSEDFAWPGEFTIEGVFYFSSISDCNIFSIGGPSNWQIQTSGTNIGIQRGSWNPASGVTLTTGQWYKIAFTRNASNDCKLWVNDVCVSTVNDATSLAAGTLLIGAAINASTLHGYVDDIKVFKGVCNYN